VCLVCLLVMVVGKVQGGLAQYVWCKEYNKGLGVCGSGQRGQKEWHWLE